MSNILHLKTMRIKKDTRDISLSQVPIYSIYYITVDYSGPLINMFSVYSRPNQALHAFESFMTEWLGKPCRAIMLNTGLDVDKHQTILFQISMEGHDWNKEKLEPYMVVNRK